MKMTEATFQKLDRKFEKKNFIADTAFECFLKDGFINTKMADIAKVAGIGKGTMYEYFESKESLMLFLIDNRVSREYAGLLQKVLKAEGVKNKMEAYLDIEKQFVGKYGRYITDIKVQFLESDSELADKIMASIFRIVGMEYEAVKEIVDLGIKDGTFKPMNPYMMTNCICSQVSSFLTASLAIHCPVDLPQEAKELFNRANYDDEEFFQILFNGLLAR